MAEKKKKKLPPGWKSALLLFALNFIQLVLFTLSTQAIIKHDYVLLFWTNAIADSIWFAIVKIVDGVNTKVQILFYAFGGAFGAVVTLYYTINIMPQMIHAIK